VLVLIEKIALFGEAVARLSGLAMLAGALALIVHH